MNIEEIAKTGYEVERTDGVVLMDTQETNWTLQTATAGEDYVSVHLSAIERLLLH